MATVTKISRPVTVAYGKMHDGLLIFIVSDPTHANKLRTVREQRGNFICDCEKGKRHCEHVDAVEERLFKAQTRQIGGVTTTREYEDRMSLNAEKAPFWFWRVA
jgi:hypothetical protein